ncbi:WG repeat-containing protein [Paenibacillus alginolyticus]|uniref:WG repeat-containing protein n=1 Tax=Paenibacillus alginolyticus TaxID=59839 RepID=A0ABT4GJK0_9BACL|nr:WG repeat-containing protein [Paenibacillus alginolyticus]MCY9696372.1 WG repeat-containing protein [Paenibacillus alginolyticus]
MQTGGSGESWKSYALDFFMDSDIPTEEGLTVRKMTFKLLVDAETSLPVRLEVISDIEVLEDDEPTGYKSTVTVTYNQLNKIQSIPLPEGLQTSTTGPVTGIAPLKKTPTISTFVKSTEVFPARYLISGGIGKGKFGFMDQNGKVVIEPKYTMALPFSEGLAPVLLNGKWDISTNLEIS